MVEQFVLHGAAVDALDAHGNTPLALAVVNHNTATVAALLKAGADPRIRAAAEEFSDPGQDALQMAEEQGYDDIVALLKEHLALMKSK